MRRDLELLSVVAPLYNEAGTLTAFVKAVQESLYELPYRLILVDDGSDDESADIARDLASTDDRIEVIRLSRNFGHQPAITAGIDAAEGDAVVTIDADLQDPPAVIHDLLEAWHNGADVVYAVRSEREGETAFKRATASAFYRLFSRLAKVEVRDTGDFRLLDRRVVDALRDMPERSRFLRGLTVWVGFNQTAVSYKREPRYAGETHFTLRKMVRFAIDGLTSFSYAPLQAATLLGFLFAGMAFLGLPIALVFRMTDQFVPGITSVLFVVLLLGGIQLITVGLIGEYIGRVYDEVKGRPTYLIAEHVNPMRTGERSDAAEESA